MAKTHKARSSIVIQNSSASALQEIKLLTDKTQATQWFESCSYWFDTWFGISLCSFSLPTWLIGIQFHWTEADA